MKGTSIWLPVYVNLKAKSVLAETEQILATCFQKGQISDSNVLAIGLVPVLLDLPLQIDNELVPGNSSHAIAVLSFEEVKEFKFGHQSVLETGTALAICLKN